MTACVYETLIAEKLNKIEDEIRRMSSALDAAKMKDNETMVWLFNTQLAKYHDKYQRLRDGSVVLRTVNEQP